MDITTSEKKKNKSRFHYLINKIEQSKISTKPFPHIWIEDFFANNDFQEIISAKENRLPEMQSDEELFDALFDSGYQIINFPGCITNKKEYLSWHSGKRAARNVHTACEGYGMTLRLTNPKSNILKEIKLFLESKEFNDVIGKKFGINVEACNIECGIQKYLDGYEISPHPDTRGKALTFMTNINSHDDSCELEHHTKYLKFKPEREYIKTFWSGNKHVDRHWVPWDWCECVSTQTSNNSLVIFSPTDDTLHAIKASYDHLKGQRTQLYGNLWYKNIPKMKNIAWEDLDLMRHTKQKKPARSLKGYVEQYLPSPLKSLLKNTFNKINSHVKRRDY